MSKDKKKKESSEVIDEIMNLIFGDDQEQGDKTIFADLLPDEETRKKQEKDKKQ